MNTNKKLRKLATELSFLTLEEVTSMMLELNEDAETISYMCTNNYADNSKLYLYLDFHLFNGSGEQLEVGGGIDYFECCIEITPDEKEAKEIIDLCEDYEYDEEDLEDKESLYEIASDAVDELCHSDDLETVFDTFESIKIKWTVMDEDGEEQEAFQGEKRIAVQNELLKELSQTMCGMTLSEGVEFLEDKYYSTSFYMGDYEGRFDSAEGEPDRIKVEVSISPDEEEELNRHGIQCIYAEIFINVNKDEMEEFFEDYGVDESERDVATFLDMLVENADEIENYCNDVDWYWDILPESGGYYRNGKLF